jgi:hypothetical protein
LSSRQLSSHIGTDWPEGPRERGFKRIVATHPQKLQSGFNLVEDHLQKLQSGFNLVEDHLQKLQSGFNLVEEGATLRTADIIFSILIFFK